MQMKSNGNNKPMSSGIFISYRYNAREMDGIEEFQCELSKSYLCQGVGKWIPACSEGGEMWVTLFLTVPIKRFLMECWKDVAKEAVIIAGKKFVLGPLKKAFRQLRKKNEKGWELKIQTCSFKFDDLEIVIGGIKQEELEQIEGILKRVHEVCEKLNPSDGFQIIRIELPSEKLPSNGEYCVDAWRFDENKLFESSWIITYADNHKTLYNPIKGKEYELR